MIAYDIFFGPHAQNDNKEWPDLTNECIIVTLSTSNRSGYYNSQI